MRGVTGGAGDVLGFGMVGRREIETRAGEPPSGVGRVPLSGQVVAAGPYCSFPPPRTDGLAEPTPERRAKGDLVWGVWKVVENVRAGHDGRLKADTTTVRAWHRADRISPLYRQGVISANMANAGRELARLAENARATGLRSQFGTVKIDGSGGSLRSLPRVGDAAYLATVMSMLGGTDSLVGGVLWLVAVEGLSLRQIEGGTTWTDIKLDRKQAAGALCAGLDLLARLWGMHEAA